MAALLFITKENGYKLKELAYETIISATMDVITMASTLNKKHMHMIETSHYMHRGKLSLSKLT